MMRFVCRLYSLTESRYGILIMLAVVVAICSTWFLDMRNDDAYITYRYAYNLVYGQGFVFNPGERILATTSPFHAILITIVAFIDRVNLPYGANVLSAIALLVLSYHCFLLLAHFGCPRAGAVCALFAVINNWTYSFFPLETVILLSLEIAMLYYYLRQRLLLAFVSGACAVLTRFDATVLIAVILVHFLIVRRDSRRLLVPGGAFLAIVLPWFIFSWTYFGTLLPNTFAAKAGFASDLGLFVRTIWPKVLSTSIGQNAYLSAIPIGLSIVSVWSALRRKQGDYLLIPMWGTLYIIAYSMLGIAFPHAWYFYPLVIISLILGCHGGSQVYNTIKGAVMPRMGKSFSLVMALATIGLVIFQLKTVREYSFAHHHTPWTTTREKAYIEASNWLRDNTEKGSTVAALEIGTVGYYSGRIIVDLLGLATPAAIPNVRSGAWSKTINDLQPDYVLVQHRVDEPALDNPESDTLVLLGQRFEGFQIAVRFSSEGYEIAIYRRTQDASLIPGWSSWIWVSEHGVDRGWQLCLSLG